MILIGLAIVIVLLIAYSGISSMGIASGNEKIININQNNWSDNNSNYYYEISCTLSNAPKEAESYFAKVTFYDSNGNIILSKSNTLKYSFINDDNTMDVFLQAGSNNPVNIDKCVIEITNNQGELITSADYQWLNT